MADQKPVYNAAEGQIFHRNRLAWYMRKKNHDLSLNYAGCFAWS